MPVSHASQRRRDPRYQLRRGSAEIRIQAAGTQVGYVQGELREVSAAGFGFELGRQEAKFEVDDIVPSVTLRIGNCSLEGELTVKTLRESGDCTVAVGALFYPATTDCEERLMSLLSGLAAGA